MTRSTKSALLNFITAIIWTFIAAANRRMYDWAISCNIHPNVFVWFMSHIGPYIALIAWAVAIVGGVGWVKQLPGKKG